MGYQQTYKPGERNKQKVQSQAKAQSSNIKQQRRQNIQIIFWEKLKKTYSNITMENKIS